jgi:hypothetical protein
MIKGASVLVDEAQREIVDRRIYAAVDGSATSSSAAPPCCRIR